RSAGTIGRTSGVRALTLGSCHNLDRKLNHHPSPAEIKIKSRIRIKMNPMSHPLKLIRVISEGRPGHENQSVGLAEAIARRTGAEIEVVRIPATWNLFTRRRAAL